MAKKAKGQVAMEQRYEHNGGQVLYAMMEQGYAYNDEIYHTGENADGRGKPLKLFKRKEVAEVALAEAMREWLGENSLQGYGYSTEEILNERALEVVRRAVEENDVLKTKEVVDQQICLDDILDHEKFAPVFQAMTNQEILDFMKYCTVAPYFIEEVEVNE